jgi:oligopeptide/dipeptide ABC transporter ATP-binding protein
LRRDLQIVFQDPLASLDPRMTVGEIIAEPVRIFEPDWSAEARRAAVVAMLERVGLSADMMSRYPHEFSGGQCQRIAIARAMILSPKLLICDEPVSSLDVSIQGQIVNLLLDLQRDAGMTMLFISHNLAVVRHLSHRILVMYSGRLVEIAPRDALFAAAIHPYTRALLAAVPSAIPLPRGVPRQSDTDGPGEPQVAVRVAAPMPVAAPPDLERGCAFRDRCVYALPACAVLVPPLAEIAAGRWVACHRASELAGPSAP